MYTYNHREKKKSLKKESIMIRQTACDQVSTVQRVLFAMDNLSHKVNNYSLLESLLCQIIRQRARERDTTRHFSITAFVQWPHYNLTHTAQAIRQHYHSLHTDWCTVISTDEHTNTHTQCVLFLFVGLAFDINVYGAGEWISLETRRPRYGLIAYA